MDEDGGLQVVVSAGPEGSLQEGAALDARLNPGQWKVLWEKELTGGDLVLQKHKPEETQYQWRKSRLQPLRSRWAVRT